MGNKFDLDTRMKKYEYITRTHLVPKTPVIIRIDGKSFHTFTRHLKKPFDEIFVQSMKKTMEYLCKNIQGCVLGYTQSDEISLLLIDYQKIDSDSWFDYNIQKCVSVAASMATMAFNKIFREYADEYIKARNAALKKLVVTADDHREDTFYCLALREACNKGAMFDARCFNLPKEEVTNYFFYRQNDATRNSIQALGQANFSHRELHGKSCNEIQNMLMMQRGTNWNNLWTDLKRGSCCKKVNVEGVNHPKWVIDNEIPVFKNEGRRYIEKLLS